MNGQKTVFALVAVVYNIKSALIRISIAQLFNSYLLHILRLVVRTEQPCVFIIELLGGGYLLFIASDSFLSCAICACCEMIITPE